MYKFVFIFGFFLFLTYDLIINPEKYKKFLDTYSRNAKKENNSKKDDSKENSPN